MKQNLSGSRLGREVTLVVRTSTILPGAITLCSRRYMLFMLRSKYGVQVQRMMLVQCHPHVCGSDFNEAPLAPDFELADEMAKALMCQSLS